MDNPETLSIFGAQNSGCRRPKHQQQQIQHRNLNGKSMRIPLLRICIPEITAFVMGRFTKSEISMVKILFESPISIL
jgi:hypothetical protein